MRRLIPLLIAGPLIILSVAACTPREHAAWLEWHAQDPAAAQAFADEWVANHQAQAQAPRAQTTNSQRSVWDRLAECESGQRWDYNGGSGYDGGLQFLPATWRAYGGRDFAEFAYQASREAQITVAERVLDDVGWGAWPACSRKLGLR